MLMACIAVNSDAGDADEKLPTMSLELLEFIADWTPPEGQWQDPVELLPMDDLDDTAVKKEENEQQ